MNYKKLSIIIDSMRHVKDSEGTIYAIKMRGDGITGTGYIRANSEDEALSIAKETWDTKDIISATPANKNELSKDIHVSNDSARPMRHVKDNSEVNDLDLADINSGLTYDDLIEMYMYHDRFGELCDQQGICPPAWDDTDIDAAAQLADSVLQGHESVSVDYALECIAYSDGFDTFCSKNGYNSPSCLYGNDESIALEHYKVLFRQIIRQHRSQFPS